MYVNSIIVCEYFHFKSIVFDPLSIHTYVYICVFSVILCVFGISDGIDYIITHNLLTYYIKINSNINTIVQHSLKHAFNFFLFDFVLNFKTFFSFISMCQRMTSSK